MERLEFDILMAETARIYELATAPFAEIVTTLAVLSGASSCKEEQGAEGALRRASALKTAMGLVLRSRPDWNGSSKEAIKASLIDIKHALNTRTHFLLLPPPVPESPAAPPQSPLLLVPVDTFAMHVRVIYAFIAHALKALERAYTEEKRDNGLTPLLQRVESTIRYIDDVEEKWELLAEAAVKGSPVSLLRSRFDEMKNVIDDGGSISKEIVDADMIAKREMWRGVFMQVRRRTRI